MFVQCICIKKSFNLLLSAAVCCIILCVSWAVMPRAHERSCLSLADVSGVDWMVRHGRSLALAIAVKSAPGKLCGNEYCDTVTETILANATADRVSREFTHRYPQGDWKTVEIVAILGSVLWFCCGNVSSDDSKVWNGNIKVTQSLLKNTRSKNIFQTTVNKPMYSFTIRIKQLRCDRR